MISEPTYCRRGLLYSTGRPASQSARSKSSCMHADCAARTNSLWQPPHQQQRECFDSASNCRHSSECRFACRLVAATASARAYALKQQRSPHERYVRTLIKVNFIIIIIIIIIFIRRKTIRKTMIENCGQNKSGNSTYNCPRNRQTQKY